MNEKLKEAKYAVRQENYYHQFLDASKYGRCEKVLEYLAN